MNKKSAIGASAFVALLALATYSLVGKAPHAVAQDKPDDFGKKYQIDARINLVSDNDLTYPTLLGKSPTKGNETILGLVEIERGRLGPTTLDGAVFAFFGEGTRRVKEKPFNVLCIYLDEKCSKEQRNAIGSIIYNDSRFQADKLNALVTTKIVVDRGSPTARSPLTPTTVKIEDRGTFTMTPCKGGDGVNPVSVLNGWTMFLERDPVVLGFAKAEWKDFGRELKVSDTAGEIHYVRIEGSAAERTPVEK
jgi:hypothetical protein